MESHTNVMRNKAYRPDTVIKAGPTVYVLGVLQAGPAKQQVFGADGPHGAAALLGDGDVAHERVQVGLGLLALDDRLERIELLRVAVFLRVRRRVQGLEENTVSVANIFRSLTYVKL